MIRHAVRVIKHVGSHVVTIDWGRLEQAQQVGARRLPFSFGSLLWGVEYRKTARESGGVR